jgi:hypothetical protein
MSKQNPETFINPIDIDKITANPHSLTYGHHVGSATIKPEDQGKLKGRAVTAMDYQTDQQLGLIYEQMKLLAEQAKKIQERKVISEKIYLAEMRFDPIINHTYHLYQRDNGVHLLSLVSPDNWGRSINKLEFIATVKLLADHTWEIILKNSEIDF